MSLQEKYKKVLDAAHSGHVKDLQIGEKEGVLTIKCKATEGVKQQMWSAYEAIDPDMRAGDMVLDVELDTTVQEEIYTVKGGDSLSKIASRYHTTWQKIFEANKDTIKNPDLIHPGQKIRIPK